MSILTQYFDLSVRITNREVQITKYSCYSSSTVLVARLIAPQNRKRSGRCELFLTTVKPLLEGHPMCQSVLSVNRKWPHKRLISTIITNRVYLPTVYVVRGKVMFWHVSVRRSFCLSTPRGGYPCQVQLGRVPWPDGGYPTSGTPPTPSDLAGGVPQRGVCRLGYPTLGTPIGPGQGVPQWGVSQQGVTPPWVLPHQTWPGGMVSWQGAPIGPGWGVPPRVTPPPPIGPGQGGYPDGGYPTLSSTWYAAVGMPLAFTQEDFLVLNIMGVMAQNGAYIEEILFYCV